MSAHHHTPFHTAIPEADMNRILALLLVASIATGCASSTMIRSNPSGANVRNKYGAVICTTPCAYEDSDAGQHTEVFEIEKPGVGRQPLVIRKENVNWGRALGFGLAGLFVWPLLIGEAWIFDYDDEYLVDLRPSDSNQSPRHSVSAGTH